MSIYVYKKFGNRHVWVYPSEFRKIKTIDGKKFFLTAVDIGNLEAPPDNDDGGSRSIMPPKIQKVQRL